MTFEITRLSACLGATITGFDPGRPIDDETASALRRLWAEHSVLIFPGLDPTLAEHLALTRAFGTVVSPRPGPVDESQLEVLADYAEISIVDNELYVFDYWHSDNTGFHVPPVGTALVMRQRPSHGGDTMWASTRRVDATMAEPLQQLCNGLRAFHGRDRRGSEHPVVATHPVSGAKYLYVNRGWTKSIVGFSSHESVALLALLFEHIERPEHTVRWSWAEGDFVVWDNRTTNHFAIRDYDPERRVLHRVTIARDFEVGDG